MSKSSRSLHSVLNMVLSRLMWNELKVRLRNEDRSSVPHSLVKKSPVHIIRRSRARQLLFFELLLLLQSGHQDLDNPAAFRHALAQSWLCARNSAFSHL